MLTRDDILQFLRDNKERFAEQYGVTKIGLFGSFARDEATEESDIDVYVEIAEPTYSGMCRLREEIMDKSLREVDLVHIWYGMDSLMKKCIKKDAIYV